MIDYKIDLDNFDFSTININPRDYSSGNIFIFLLKNAKYASSLTLSQVDYLVTHSDLSCIDDEGDNTLLAVMQCINTLNIDNTQLDYLVRHSDVTHQNKAGNNCLMQVLRIKRGKSINQHVMLADETFQYLLKHSDFTQTDFKLKSAMDLCFGASKSIPYKDYCFIMNKCMSCVDSKDIFYNGLLTLHCYFLEDCSKFISAIENTDAFCSLITQYIEKEKSANIYNQNSSFLYSLVQEPEFKSLIQKNVLEKVIHNKSKPTKLLKI